MNFMLTFRTGSVVMANLVAFTTHDIVYTHSITEVEPGVGREPAISAGSVQMSGLSLRLSM